MIDAPRYQAVVGSLRQPAPAQNLAVKGDGRAAVAVISLDGEPLARTRRASLATVGEFRDRGEKLEDQGEWQSWEPGQQPIEMRSIRATLTLKDWARAGQLICYALDARGARAAKVPVQARGTEAVIELQAYPYAWFELVAE